jgi:rhodanese-related sulfurtransferase
MPSDIRPSEFLDRDPSAPVLDVRTPQEFAEGHLEGARNVDFLSDDFEQQFDALDLPKDQTVYLHCRSGGRSQKAAELLRSKGYSDAVNAGGFEDLAKAGAPTA